MISMENMLDILLSLNELYDALEGDELVIKEEEIGRFKFASEFEIA